MSTEPKPMTPGGKAAARKFSELAIANGTSPLRMKLLCEDPQTWIEVAHAAIAASEIEQLKRERQVLLDIHAALGIKWGDDPYAVIRGLKIAADRANDPVRENKLVEALRNARSGLIQLADRPVHWYVNQIDAALAEAEQLSKEVMPDDNASTRPDLRAMRPVVSPQFDPTGKVSYHDTVESTKRLNVELQNRFGPEAEPKKEKCPNKLCKDGKIICRYTEGGKEWEEICPTCKRTGEK